MGNNGSKGIAQPTQQEIQKALQEQKRLVDQLWVMRNEKDAVATELERVKKENEEFRRKRNVNLEKKVDELEKELNLSRAQQNQENAKQYVAQIEAMNTEINAWKAKCQGLQVQVDDLSTKKTDSESKILDEMSKYRSHIGKLEAEKASLSQSSSVEIEKHTLNNKNLLEELQRSRSEIEKLKQEMQNRSNDDGAQTSKDEFNERIEKLSLEVQQAKEAHVKAESEFTVEIEKKNNEIENLNKLLESKNALIEDRVNSISTNGSNSSVKVLDVHSNGSLRTPKRLSFSEEEEDSDRSSQNEGFDDDIDHSEDCKEPKNFEENEEFHRDNIKNLEIVKALRQGLMDLHTVLRMAEQERREADETEETRRSVIGSVQDILEKGRGGRMRTTTDLEGATYIAHRSSSYTTTRGHKRTRSRSVNDRVQVITQSYPSASDPTSPRSTNDHLQSRKTPPTSPMTLSVPWTE